MTVKVKARDVAKGRIKTKTPKGKICLRGHVKVRAFDKEGNLKWEDEDDNLVVNEGLNHLLDVTLSGATPITTWYIGLINGASPTLAAADTMSSHSGWTPNQNYSESVRQTWTEAGVSSQSISNTASPATFSINVNSQTIGGVFLTSSNTKGGTAGSLYAEFAFGTAKALDSGESIEVTYTFTMADDGV